jgi:hypothetical protein
MSNLDLLTGPNSSVDVDGFVRGFHQNTQANAIYAHVVARAYERNVEHAEPEEAMRAAIERAEEVVRVWREVVK